MPRCTSIGSTAPALGGGAAIAVALSLLGCAASKPANDPGAVHHAGSKQRSPDAGSSGDAHVSDSGTIPTRPPIPPPKFAGQCSENADCASPNLRCVVIDREGRRSCEGGFIGAFCNEAADCELGGCALPADSYVGRCSDGQAGSPCYAPADCAGGLLCGDVPDDYPGPCVEPGSSRAPCTTDAECRAGRCVALGSGVKLCSEGKAGEPCDEVGDCSTAHCVDAACSTGMPPSPCNGDEDCTASYCGTISDQGAPPVRTCTIGARGDPCERDAQCQRGFCVAAAGSWGSCEDGDVGQHCLDAADCKSGACTAPGADGRSQCTDGSANGPCASDADCASGLCVTPKPGEGTCSDGANGAQCIDGADCKAGSCVLQPGGGLPGTCGAFSGMDLGGGCSACTQSLSSACSGDRPVLWLCNGPLPGGGLPAALGTDCTDLATDLPRFCCPLGLRASCPPG